MSAGGMYLGGTYKRRITWGEVPGIYKARFLRLWRVLKLSLLASIIAIVTVALLPLILGIALFSTHVLLTGIVVSAAHLVSGWLYWKSLKLALGIEHR
jgi:uncharacterized membrane protein